MLASLRSSKRLRNALHARLSFFFLSSFGCVSPPSFSSLFLLSEHDLCIYCVKNIVASVLHLIALTWCTAMPCLPLAIAGNRHVHRLIKEVNCNHAVQTFLSETCLEI